MKEPKPHIMNPPAPPPGIPVVIVNLNTADMVQLLSLNPYLHQPTNDVILPEGFKQLRDALVSTGKVFGGLEELFDRLTLPDIDAAFRKTKLELIRTQLDGFQVDLDDVKKGMDGMRVLMDVLEGSGHLTDWNKTTFEEIERLAFDVREDLLRIKERYEGMEVAEEDWDFVETELRWTFMKGQDSLLHMTA